MLMFTSYDWRHWKMRFIVRILIGQLIRRDTEWAPVNVCLCLPICFWVWSHKAFNQMDKDSFLVIS